MLPHKNGFNESSAMHSAQSKTDRFHFDVYNRYPVTITEGRGTKVWTDDGRELIDALAGIAVNSLGHCHPAVVSAIMEQAQKLMHISNFYYSEPQSNLVERLSELTGMEKLFLSNSGAEAIEGAIKLARKWGHTRQRSGPILTMSNAFHGRTITTITMGMDKYSEGYAPLAQGFEQVKFNDINSLTDKFGLNPVAVILEPIQGSGGLQVASAEFMKAIGTLCKKHNTLLIIDEVQTGVARTGRMWGYQHYEVDPDIIVSAKALGGGFPISAVAAKESVAAAMTYGSHGSTFGGNPLGCAAALASLQAIADEDLVQQAKEKGRWLKSKLMKEAETNESIVDVRGNGLMLGVELAFEGRQVVDIMLEKGVLSNCTQGNVIRLVPPLVIQYNELKTLFAVLIESINEAANN